jgi:hypothetical protein
VPVRAGLAKIDEQLHYQRQLIDAHRCMVIAPRERIVVFEKQQKQHGKG